MRHLLKYGKQALSLAVLLVALPVIVAAETTSSSNYMIEGGSFSSGSEPSVSSTNYIIQGGSLGDGQSGAGAASEEDSSPSGSGSSGIISSFGGGSSIYRYNTLTFVPVLIGEAVYEGVRAVVDIFRPAPKPAETPVLEIVEREAPSVLAGLWQLLDPDPIRELVLAPLPKEILALTSKFPDFGRVLSTLGVSRMSDLDKLRGAEVKVPSLAEVVEGDVPTGIVFISSHGGLVDLAASLNVSDTGVVEQKIGAIAGKPLKLTIKPAGPVDGITGYIAFRKAAPRTAMELPLTSMAAAALAVGALRSSPQEAPISSEDKLVVASFEYQGPDKDGLYTAEIRTPEVEGEYEIINVIRYRDEKLGTRELRMIAVVDPEGYVYEVATGGLEARVPMASVTIWKEPATGGGAVAKWNASDYSQENPQTTDKTGKYSYLVPEGRYYITAEARSYQPYRSDSFDVTEGRGVHFNIELKRAGSWLDGFLDWKSALIVLFALALAVNFYNDRRLMKKLLSEDRRYPS